MLKKHWIMLLILLMVVSTIAACSPNNNPSNNVNETNNNTNEPANTNNNAPATAEPEVDYANMDAEITIFGLMAHATFDDLLRPHLEETFPNYTITYIAENDGLTISEHVVAGTDIDLYIGRAGGIVDTYIPLDLAYDMSELLEKHGVNTDDFEEAYIDNVTIDGKLYALPFWNDTMVMYYNKELFDRFGVGYPTDGMTWDEAIELADEMTRFEDGTQYIGLWMSPKHYFRMNQLSLDFVNPETMEADVMTDGWNTIFDKLFYQTTRDPGVQARAAEQWFAHADFNWTKTVSMYVFMTNWLSTSEASLPLDWDIVSMPTFEDRPGVGTQPYADFIGITSISDEKDAAMQVVKYLTGEDFQTIISRKGKITPLKSQAVRDAAFLDHPNAGEKNFDAVYVNEIAPIRNVTPYDELVIENAFNDTIVPEIAQGLIDVNSALQKAQDIANLAIEQAKLGAEE